MENGRKSSWPYKGCVMKAVHGCRMVMSGHHCFVKCKVKIGIEQSLEVAGEFQILFS